MLDIELEQLYQSHNGLSHPAALRLVYDAGYFAGAGITPTSSTTEPSVAAAKPITTTVAAIKSIIKK